MSETIQLELDNPLHDMVLLADSRGGAVIIEAEDGPFYRLQLFRDSSPVKSCFEELVESHHGLPLISRTIDEIIDDHNLTERCLQSQEKSTERRKYARFKSALPEKFLDNLNGIIDSVTKEMTPLINQYMMLNEITLRYK